MARAKHAYGLMFRVKGVATTAAALLIGTIGPWAMSQWSEIAAKDNVAIASAAKPFVNHPWLISLIALPALACGVHLLITPRHRWIMIAISTASLLAALIIVLSVMMPALESLYTFKPL